MRVMFLIIVMAGLISSQAFAATVFLKDGSKETGSSAWLEGSTIYLNKSNQIYGFSSDEVNMEETLKYNRIGKYADVTIPDSKTYDHQEKIVNKEKLSKKKAKTKPTAKKQKAVQSEEILSADDSSPFFGVPIPEDSTACTPELQNELLARYIKYNMAAEAGDFDEFGKHIIAYQAEGNKKALTGLSKKELQKRRKVLQEMATKNYHATACMVSPDGATAAVAGRGKSFFQGKLVDAHGTISLKKENQFWKVQTTVWNPSM